MYVCLWEHSTIPAPSFLELWKRLVHVRGPDLNMAGSIRSLTERKVGVVGQETKIWGDKSGVLIRSKTRQDFVDHIFILRTLEIYWFCKSHMETQLDVCVRRKSSWSLLVWKGDKVKTCRQKTQGDSNVGRIMGWEKSR